MKTNSNQKTTRMSHIKLLRMTERFAYIMEGNEIKRIPITTEAQQILDWERRHIPANDN